MKFAHFNPTNIGIDPYVNVGKCDVLVPILHMGEKNYSSSELKRLAQYELVAYAHDLYLKIPAFMQSCQSFYYLHKMYLMHMHMNIIILTHLGLESFYGKQQRVQSQINSHPASDQVLHNLLKN